MKIELSPEDLRPVIAEIVAEALRQLGPRTPVNQTAGTVLLDVKAAAKRLGIGTTTLREIPPEEIPVVRIGRCVRYRPQDLDAYARRRSDLPLERKTS